MKQLLIILAFLFVGNLAYSQTCGICSGVPSRTLTANPGTGTAPFTYSWSGTPVTTTQTKVVTVAGNYTVTMTDANGCTATATFNVPSLTPPSGSGVVTNGTCGNLGSINVTASSGQSPYTFLWSNGATTEDITGLASGTYSVVVTDANGCKWTSPTYTVTNTSAATVTISCN